MNGENSLPSFDFEEFETPGSRCLIVGPSGSGKTFLLTNVIYPTVYKKYHILWILTQEKNKSTYEKMIPKKKLFIKEKDEYGLEKMVQLPIVVIQFPTNAQEVNDNIQKIMNLQASTDRKYNIFLIYDDIYLPDLKKASLFVQQFTNFRMWNISLFFLIQTFTEVLSNTIVGNCSHIIVFQPDTSYFINYIKRQIIEPYVLKQHVNEYKTAKKMGFKTSLTPAPSKKELEKKIDEIYSMYLVLPDRPLLIMKLETRQLYTK